MLWVVLLALASPKVPIAVMFLTRLLYSDDQGFDIEFHIPLVHL